jgi:hypothetical protein
MGDHFPLSRITVEKSMAMQPMMDEKGDNINDMHCKALHTSSPDVSKQLQMICPGVSHPYVQVVLDL